MTRFVQKKIEHCAVCARPVELATLDSPHPEAPTLFQVWVELHPRPWFGFVDGGKIVVLCSGVCAQRLLEE